MQHLSLLWARDRGLGRLVRLEEQLTDEPFLAEFGHLLFFCRHVRLDCLLEYWPMASPFKAPPHDRRWVWLAPRRAGERHAASGTASPGACAAVAANGSGTRSPER